MCKSLRLKIALMFGMAVPVLGCAHILNSWGFCKRTITNDTIRSLRYGMTTGETLKILGEDIADQRILFREQGISVRYVVFAGGHFDHAPEIHAVFAEDRLSAVSVNVDGSRGPLPREAIRQVRGARKLDLDQGSPGYRMKVAIGLRKSLFSDVASVRLDMASDKVKDLLGNPDHVLSCAAGRIWIYKGPPWIGTPSQAVEFKGDRVESILRFTIVGEESEENLKKSYESGRGHCGLPPVF